MEPDGDSPPFWTQSPTIFPNQRRREPPSPIINPVALILLIPIIALLLLFLLIPQFLTHASLFIRPNSVKKSWDSLNVLLVVFAILCGVFARRNDDVSERNDAVAEEAVPDFECSDRRVSVSRLRRSYSSYPDLRQEPTWEIGENNFRFYDDFEVNLYRSSEAAEEYEHHRARWREEEIKVIPVDKVAVSSSPPLQAKLRRRRSLNSVSRKKNLETHYVENRAPTPPPPPPPPPKPPASQPPIQFQEEKAPKLHRNKSEIERAIARIYNQEKRKQRTKIRTIHENYSASEKSPSSEHSSAPPQTPSPPPPSPSPKVFHNLFKKSTKSKTVHSVPPPPPPPPKSILNNLFKSGGKMKHKHIHKPSSDPQSPPLSPNPSIVNSLTKSNKIRRIKSANLYSSPPPQTPAQFPPPQLLRSLTTKNRAKSQIDYNDEILNSGSRSPLIPAPPPPPPPFGMPEMMDFVPRGDFVRIRRCSSPEQIDGEDSITCPSPDVNVKAETFIARLRDEWRMEKINSLRRTRTLG